MIKKGKGDNYEELNKKEEKGKSNVSRASV